MNQQPSQLVRFEEDDNDVVMEVTYQQESEFMSEDGSDDYQQEIMSMQDAEFEDAMSKNNNATSSDTETIVEVPPEIRKLYEDGIETQKKQTEELASSREEIRALKASVAKFEQMLAKQPILLKNPEYRIRSEIVKPRVSTDPPSRSKSQQKHHDDGKQSSRGKEFSVEQNVSEGIHHIRAKLNSTTTVYQPAVRPEGGNVSEQVLADLGYLQSEDLEIQFNFKRSSSSEEEN